MTTHYLKVSLFLLILVSVCRSQRRQRPPRQDECSQATDCPIYSYCLSSYWNGRTCESNYKRQSHLDTVYCMMTDGKGKEWPDHKACREWEAKTRPHLAGRQDGRYSTARCYQALGYTCARSYYMPCTPNHDSEGRVIRGQEKSCPEKFTCENKMYGKSLVDVCVPVKVELTDECRTNFDCGYSVLEGGWSGCFGGRCRRVVEK